MTVLRHHAAGIFNRSHYPKYPAADPAAREQMMVARAEIVAELGTEQAGAEQADQASPH